MNHDAALRPRTTASGLQPAAEPAAAAGGSARPPARRPGTGPAGPAGRRPRAAGTHRADPRCALVHAFAVLWLEVEAGRRPPSRLFWLMDARLVARLAGRWDTRGGAPGHVRSVTGAQTAPGRFDAVAVVERAGRAGALAVRLVRDAAGWKVAEAACPEGRSWAASRPFPR